MVKCALILALSLLALTACATQSESNPEPPSETDKIAAGVAATLEARRIEAAITSTLEAIATSTPVPTLQPDVIVITDRSGEDESWDLLRAKVGTHKTGAEAPSALDLEREALVTLFETTGGESWNLSDNWLSDRPVGEWFGVTTGGDGRVTELRLRYNILAGELPAELGNLANLRVLNLSGTGLSGEIPRELGSLTNLVELWLWGNELSGEIPPELGNLASLESLALSANNLSGGIPPQLGSLARLKWLDLSRNRLSGEVPAQLGNLSNLDEMYLFENQLGGCIPVPLMDQLTNEVSLPFCPPSSP